MKINIKNEKTKFCIRIPTALIFSRFGASFIKFEIKKEGGGSHRLSVYPEHMKNIRRCIKNMRKLHPEWCFLEAEGSDGSTVTIRL